MDRFSALFFLMSRLLWPLRSVLRASLLSFVDAGGVERSADDVVTDAGKIFHPASANHYYRVLLEIVPFSGDVGGDLNPVRQPDARNLPQRRIWLLGGRRIDASADAPLLRIARQCRSLALEENASAAESNQLVDSGQTCSEF